MQRVSWKDKVTNVIALERVNETRNILDTISCQEDSWLGHILKHDGLLKNSRLLKEEYSTI